MSKNQKNSGTNGLPLLRSSAAEYLTFVAASGTDDVEAAYADESIWLTQKMMGMLYAVETHAINYHLKKVFSDNELQENSVIRNFRITAADGKNYNTKHYKLPAIIAVGYKVNSEGHKGKGQILFAGGQIESGSVSTLATLLFCRNQGNPHTHCSGHTHQRFEIGISFLGQALVEGLFV
jgi:hypothetical protein